jgi:hypothetical protein
MHERFPDLSFDCTTKVEHILYHEGVWEELASAGCLFVVSALECVNDEILERLEKGHTTAESSEAIALLRGHGIEIRPSFMPFTPWTTLEDVVDILDFVAEHDLIGNVDPVQYTIRLLLPEGSLLLGHPDLAPCLGEYDAERATYAWRPEDPAMDTLQAKLTALVDERQRAGDDTAAIYAELRAACGLAPVQIDASIASTRPRLTESWFCCAEPTAEQLNS